MTKIRYDALATERADARRLDRLSAAASRGS
jgi:hypothetical protein